MKKIIIPILAVVSMASMSTFAASVTTPSDGTESRARAYINKGHAGQSHSGIGLALEY